MPRPDGPRRRMKQEKKEFEEEVLQVDRVTRVVKGGRRLSFRATVVIGNGKGKVGVGLGKSNEVSAAVQKGVTQAKKHLLHIPIAKGDTIPHQVFMKFKATKIFIFPAAPGTGLKAGSSTRKILELAGIKNILAKRHGSQNRINLAKATILALTQLSKRVKPGERRDPKDSRDLKETLNAQP